MNRRFLSILFFIPSVGFACPSLQGDWQSSKQDFIAFNQQWANIESRAWDFMLQSQGLETIEFDVNAKQMIIQTPAHKISMGDAEIENPAAEENLTFHILGCNDNSIVIQYERYGKAVISHLQFVNDSTYWEYVGQPGQSGNGHIREFYNRVKKSSRPNLGE